MDTITILVAGLQYGGQGRYTSPPDWPRQRPKAGASWDDLEAGGPLLEDPAAAWVDGLSWEEPGPQLELTR